MRRILLVVLMSIMQMVAFASTESLGVRPLCTVVMNIDESMPIGNVTGPRRAPRRAPSLSAYYNELGETININVSNLSLHNVEVFLYKDGLEIEDVNFGSNMMPSQYALGTQGAGYYELVICSEGNTVYCGTINL